MQINNWHASFSLDINKERLLSIYLKLIRIIIKFILKLKLKDKILLNLRNFVGSIFLLFLNLYFRKE